MKHGTVESWMPYVLTIARREHRRHMDLDAAEFESAAMLGLAQAWKKFDGEDSTRHFRCSLALHVECRCRDYARSIKGTSLSLDAMSSPEDRFASPEDVEGAAITSILIEQFRAMLPPDLWAAALAVAEGDGRGRDEALRRGCSRAHISKQGHKAIRALQRAS